MLILVFVFGQKGERETGVHHKEVVVDGDSLIDLVDGHGVARIEIFAVLALVCIGNVS